METLSFAERFFWFVITFLLVEVLICLSVSLKKKTGREKVVERRRDDQYEEMSLYRFLWEYLDAVQTGQIQDRGLDYLGPIAFKADNDYFRRHPEWRTRNVEVKTKLEEIKNWM